MSNDERDSLVRQIMAAIDGDKPTRKGPIPSPLLKMNRSDDPALYRAVQKAYVSAVLDTPTCDWTPAMKSALAAESREVLTDLGY
jgi:hypothetical protein